MRHLWTGMRRRAGDRRLRTSVGTVLLSALLVTGVLMAPVVSQSQPVVGRPVVGQPSIGQPVVDRHVVDQPVVDQPHWGKALYIGVSAGLTDNSGIACLASSYDGERASKR